MNGISERRDSLETAIRRTDTHDCEFTRGYWLGVASEHARLDPSRSICLRVPESLIDELRTLLGDVLTVGRSSRNKFGVTFTSIWIWS